MIFIIEIILHLSTGERLLGEQRLSPDQSLSSQSETSKTNLPAYDQAFSFCFKIFFIVLVNFRKRRFARQYFNSKTFEAGDLIRIIRIKMNLGNATIL